MIISEYPNVQLIRNHENLGFSKAVNIGEGYAIGDFLCVLNPDTLLSEDTFKILVTYLQNHPRVGCIGPKILNSDGNEIFYDCKRNTYNVKTGAKSDRTYKGGC